MRPLMYRTWLIYHPGYGWLDRDTYERRDIDEEPIWVPPTAFASLMERAWMFDTRELALACIADRKMDASQCVPMAVEVGIAFLGGDR